MMHGEAGIMIAVSLLSLVAGSFLLMKVCKEDVCCKLFYKIVGYAVVIISILLIICGGYWKIVKFTHHGWGRGMGGMEMMGGKGMKPEMMKEMMKNCPMMKMMEEMQEMKKGE